jgi:hypothetical protein
MKAVSELQVTLTRPIKPRRATVQLIAAAVSAQGRHGFVGGVEVVGGGMGAKLSVRDAEQEGATHRGRKLEPALPIFCFASPHSPLERRSGQPLQLITKLFDPSSFTALACVWDRGSSINRLSTSNSIAAGRLDSVQYVSPLLFTVIIMC